MFSVYPFPLWWLREYIYIYFVLCLIIIIKSEVWTITHCLGLGHETMVCAVCLSVFLCTWFSLCSVLLWSETDWSYPYPSGSLHWHWDNHTIASMPLKPPWIRRMNHTNALWYYNQNNITKQVKPWAYIDGLVRDCSNSIANALELLVMH